MKPTQFLVAPGEKLRLKDHDPGFTSQFANEQDAQPKLEADCAALAAWQDKLMAQSTHGLLLVFQAMDGSAKDGTIKHIMSAADPQGCAAHNFKQPAETEAKHDYLWRFHRLAPARGEIVIFNRSYYEEVLVTRVHPERLAEEHLPVPTPQGQKLWRQRFAQINNFEQYLVENGILVIKFFLHLSKSKQKERLLERMKQPEKRWKFSPADVEERQHWGSYMRAYEDMLASTSTPHAPWYIVPADHRWYSAFVVAELIIAQLTALNPRYPPATDEEKKQITKAQKTLAGKASN